MLKLFFFAVKPDAPVIFFLITPLPFFCQDEIQKLHRGVVNGIHEYEGKMLAAESAQSAVSLTLESPILALWEPTLFGYVNY